MAIHNRYNGFQYDEARYNVEDLPALLLDVITPADAIVKTMLLPKVDTTVLVDDLAKSITSKVLSDGVRSNDWFTIKNDPQSDPWS